MCAWLLDCWASMIYRIYMIKVDCTIKSGSSAEMEQIGEKLGMSLRGGEVIELVGDVGSGKTTFVRGLARGMGSPDHVSSPTFTISKLYKSKSFDLVHFDFYRLQSADLIGHELQDHIDGKAVIVVEWSDIVRHVLPEERLAITIAAAAEGNRELSINCPPNLKYLLEGIC